MTTEKKQWPFPSAYLRTRGVSWGKNPELRWQGKHVALVRFPGHSDGRTFGTYYPTHWEILGKREDDPERYFQGATSARPFWESKEGERLAPSVMVELAKGIDERYPELLAKRKADQALRNEAERTRREKENAAVRAAERLHEAAPKLLAFVERFLAADLGGLKGQPFNNLSDLRDAAEALVKQAKGVPREHS